MKRILTALVAASTLAGAALVTSAPAEAYWRGGWGWRGGGWGWGVGGFVAGAAVGAALASPYYGYPYGYYGYYAPYPYPPPCVWRRVWNGYAWVSACV
jgi:hypothetical protein